MGIESRGGGFPRIGDMVVFKADGAGRSKSTDIKPEKPKKTSVADLFAKWTGLSVTDERVKKVRKQEQEKAESKKKPKKQPWED